MSRTKRTLTGVLAAALLVAATPIAALAQTSDTPTSSPATTLTQEEISRHLETAKGRVLDAIDLRLDALNRLTARVNSADYLSDDHAATLLAEYDAARSTLNAAIDSVKAATTYTDLQKLTRAIFEDTLVFALLGPKTHAVIASDTVGGVIGNAGEYQAKLQAALDQLAQSGVDTTTAQSDLDQAAGLITDAAAMTAPVADSVIGLQPGDGIREPLESARDALEQSRRQLDDARELLIDATEFVLDTVATTP
jgi:hypothetical protein